MEWMVVLLWGDLAVKMLSGWGRESVRSSQLNLVSLEVQNVYCPELVGGRVG